MPYWVQHLSSPVFECADDSKSWLRLHVCLVDHWGGMTARYEVLLLYWSALLGEHGLSSALPPLVRVTGGPRKTDQFVWSLLTVGNTVIYHCLDQTGYGLRHLGIIPSMVASHHQPLNWVHEPNVQTCSSCTEQDYCHNDSVISRVKLTYLMTA